MDQTPTLQNVSSKLVPWLHGKLAGEAAIGTAEINAQHFIFKGLNDNVVLQITLPEIATVTMFPANNGGTNIGITLKDGRDFMLEGIEKDSGLPESSQVLAHCKAFGVPIDDYAANLGSVGSDFAYVPKYVYIIVIFIIVAVSVYRLLG